MKNNSIKTVGVLGLFLNLILLALKLIIGFIFNSYAIIADALNSFSDVFSSIITYVGAKISDKPSDNCHNFGHEKAEYVGSLFIGSFMIIASLNMMYKSIESMIIGKTYSFSYYLLIVPIITIITKFIFYIYVSKLSKKYDNLLLKANSEDQINDVFIAFGIILSIVFGRFEIYFIDLIVSFIISVIIVITGIKIFIKSYNVLIDRSMDFNLNDDITEKINNIEEIYSIDSIKSKPTGYKHLVIIEIRVNKDITVEKGHNIAHKVKDIINTNDKVYDCVVHVNPSI